MSNQFIAQSSPVKSPSTKHHTKQVIGYITTYDAWKNIENFVKKGTYTHLNLDFSQYSILNFAFFGLAKDGSLHSADFLNREIYRPETSQEPRPLIYDDIWSSWDPTFLLGSSNLLTEAHRHGVKVMASICGWSMSKHCPEVFRTPAKRARFIEECKKLISMGFDGIDLDWEFPGAQGMNIYDHAPLEPNGSSEDHRNFVILMKELRAAIGPNKLLTAAFICNPDLLHFDWDSLNEVMDYYNMMTYDINGGWSDHADHNSPLYPSKLNPNSLDTTTRFLVDEKKVPPHKINLGVAFYGRGVITDGMASLHAPTIKKNHVFVRPDGPVDTCADFDTWDREVTGSRDEITGHVFSGTPFYSYIEQVTGPGSGWERRWDDQSKVPYKVRGNRFISYDDQESVTLKARYVKEQNLAGLIVWTVFGDWMNLMEGSTTLPGTGQVPVIAPQVRTPLINAINEEFGRGTDVIPDKEQPRIWLERPKSGNVFTQPTDVELVAGLHDPEKRLIKVQFYINGELQGETSTAPYTWLWKGAPAGSHQLQARAVLRKRTTRAARV